MNTAPKSRFALRFAVGAVAAVVAGAAAFALADKGPRVLARAGLVATDGIAQLQTRATRHESATVADNLRVVQVGPNRLEAFLRGTREDDTRAILDSHLKRATEEHRAETRADAEKNLQKLEQQAESLKLEIERAELEIRRVPSLPDRDTQLTARLQVRQAELGVQLREANARLLSASSARDALRTEAATAARDEQLKSLEAEIETETKRRDSLMIEMNSLGKLINAGVQDGINVAGLRAALEPQRALLQRIMETLAQQRVELKLQLIEVLPATVEPLPIPVRVWVLVGAVAVAGFACGFFAAGLRSPA